MVSPADYRRRRALSWRIRAFVGILAIRHLGFAYAFVEGNGTLRRSRTFRYVFEVASPWTWAYLLAALGVLFVGGVFFPRERGIRALLVLSVGLSCALSAGTLLAEVLDPPTSSSIAAVAFLTFALKDLVVSGMVYANPIEELVSRTSETELRREHRRRSRDS